LGKKNLHPQKYALPHTYARFPNFKSNQHHLTPQFSKGFP